MADTQDKRDEKIGRAIVTFSWWIFAAKFLVVVTFIAGVVIFFLEKPLWIAPVVAVILFIIYKLIWRLIWRFIEWAGRQ
jgi:membrane protein YdbS with pleckstrin-like domain